MTPSFQGADFHILTIYINYNATTTNDGHKQHNATCIHSKFDQHGLNSYLGIQISSDSERTDGLQIYSPIRCEHG